MERWIGKARCALVHLTTRIKRKRKGKEEFYVRLVKLSGRKDYRKVFGVGLGIVHFFKIIV